MRHEQGAGFAADGFARVSGKPGLAIATTGPGAYNALTAISEAYLDSSAVLLLAGQIDSDYIGRDWGILHETIDQGAVFEQVTKFVGRPRTPDQLPAMVANALRAMLTGRHRPAYVEMPTDLLTKAAVRAARRRRRGAAAGPAEAGRSRPRRGAAGQGPAAAHHRRAPASSAPARRPSWHASPSGSTPRSS